MDALCGTTRNGVLCDTMDLEDFSASGSFDLQETDFMENDTEDIDMLDEYVLNLDEGLTVDKDLFEEDTIPSCSKGIIQNPLGE
ncbi:hypothetical protein NDU88_000988 [Pleurodeles waltl]|uniref:Uncharacterized protein n=1 Tax=Pleurodeles waltl TaxID=8319 RepID=A0AAV7UVN3_PLEWA|nr:hypothetical protein NDU88_000988 [Pleurodeles waltl]